MRLFEIKDESNNDKTIGYLIYYVNAKAFYIELATDIDIWEFPPVLSSFTKRGEYSIDSYWSRLWIEQRIIPRDRQNIGHILKECGLSEYDEFSLLNISKGRCAQDDYYIAEISKNAVPKLLLDRWTEKVEDVVPLDAPRLLVFFRNGNVKHARSSTAPDRI